MPCVVIENNLFGRCQRVLAPAGLRGGKQVWEIKCATPHLLLLEAAKWLSDVAKDKDIELVERRGSDDEKKPKQQTYELIKVDCLFDRASRGFVSLYMDPRTLVFVLELPNPASSRQDDDSFQAKNVMFMVAQVYVV